MEFEPSPVEITIDAINMILDEALAGVEYAKQHLGPHEVMEAEYAAAVIILAGQLPEICAEMLRAHPQDGYINRTLQQISALWRKAVAEEAVWTSSR